MLIIIPSYKRIEILKLVINSVIQSHSSRIGEKIRIVVVNNYYNNKHAIDQIIEEIDLSQQYNIYTLHREITLPGIDSWYSAIKKYAYQDEVIMLLGDDDLILPWGLYYRYSEVKRAEADMLLSDHVERIYFFDEGRKYYLTSQIPNESLQAKKAKEWQFYPLDSAEPSFMSNHCYRYTENFLLGLELAYKWCEAQSWLSREVNTAMLPFYMPYAISLVGGKVVSLKSKSVLRGALAEEAMHTSFADGGNIAFYNLCAFDTFNNKDLKCWDTRMLNVGPRFYQDIISSYITIFFDRKISLYDALFTIRHSGIKNLELLKIAALNGLIKTLYKALGFGGMRLKLLKKSNKLLPIENLFR